jgi:hypothetical protein
LIVSRRSSSTQTTKRNNERKRKGLRVPEDFAMTITDDYKVFAGRYHPPSSAISRLPEVRRSGVWCGKHVRFTEEPRSELIAETKATRTRGVKKEDKDWEIKYLNTKGGAQGRDYDFYLGDEDKDEVTYKDQALPKDAGGLSKPVIGETGKPIKERRYVVVRRKTAFISKDTCSACITWDRAKGSEVLKAHGIAGSFVMCCATKTEGGKTYCDTHTKKAPKLGNFWEGGYKESRGSRVGGMSYAKFLVEKCGGDAVGEGVDRDYCVGKGAKW